MAKETYNDLIFKLGDLARDVLPEHPDCPESMQQVYEAEEALVARREELAELEQQLNDEDAAYNAYLAKVENERTRQQATVLKYRRAVDAIEAKVRDLRKRAATMGADLRYAKENFKKTEAKHADLERMSRNAEQLALSRENIKKTRLALLRQERELEDAQRDLELALTPEEGQWGAQGILAHKRLLGMEDEGLARKAAFDQKVAEIDALIAAKEEEVRAAEDYLDQTLFLLGEDCYGLRLDEPELAALYPKLDKVAPR